jgi:hypothetical protein
MTTATATVDDYIESLDEPLSSVARTLRDHMDANLAGAQGQIWHGHPVWLSGKTPLAGFKAYPKYVTLLLWRGQDISEELAPAGSDRMATLKISNPAELHGPTLRHWLNEASKLES